MFVTVLFFEEKNTVYVNLLNESEYNSNNRLKNKRIRRLTMAQRMIYYCPILGKKVEIKGDFSQKKKVSFEPNVEKGYSQAECSVCNGNCSGCRLM